LNGLEFKRIKLSQESIRKLQLFKSRTGLTYLRLMDLPLGLLINFGAPLMKEGLHRVVNKTY